MHSNFRLPGQGRPPVTILGTRKLQTHGLPDGEIRIHLRSLVSTQYRSAMDGQMDGLAAAQTMLAKLALRSGVNIP